MSTALQLARPHDHEPPEVSHRFSFDELQRVANVIAKSGMFSDIRTPEAAMALVLLCDSENLHPMQAVRRFHIVKNKPAMRADAMLAEFQNKGGILRWIERTDLSCSGRFIHPIHAPEPGELVTFTMDDADRAGLPKSNENYRKYPRNMLQARVISDGIRLVLPGVIVGIYTPEEVQDFEDRPASRQLPSRPEAPAPTRSLPLPNDMPILGQPSPGGHDPRSYSQVVKAACEATGDVVPFAEGHRHLWTVAAAKGLVPAAPKPKGLKEAVTEMVDVYETDRAWVRHELALFLDEKVREAQALTDPPAPEDGDDDIPDEFTDPDFPPEPGSDG